MAKPIKIVDLFAGPGGLGEGFSSLRAKKRQPFQIALSIEKETSAHRTLTLRALFRQYDQGHAPESYYAFLRGELGRNPEEELYRLPELQEALSEAQCEAQQLTLGEDSHREVYGKIRGALDGEECILIGGPPCQAYSLVGRSRNYGAKDKQYSATEDHRNFLYREYLRIIAKFQPMVFVMENVKGMLSAKVDGQYIFPSIRSDLQDPCRSSKVQPDKNRDRHRYRIYSFVPETGNLSLFEQQGNTDNKELNPKDFIIRSENYGVPQARHRVILLGIREDIAQSLGPIKLLKPTKSSPTVRQVISDLPAIRSKISKGQDSTEAWRDAIRQFDKKPLQILARDSHVSDIVYDQFVECLGSIGKSPDSYGCDKGMSRGAFSANLNTALKTWYRDPRLGDGVVNHESRGHISGDLHRYLYYSVYAKVVGTSPKSLNLPRILWPEHKNFDSGKFADRFRVQRGDSPGTTVTSHISKDGHYFIHYDPAQCRSLTVREAARLQTFPDNYYFVGNRTQQYTQVGNAVPPFLAMQLAEVVHNLLE
jgi:DNA (cytosine-5)-methyltransferase 1